MMIYKSSISRKNEVERERKKVNQLVESQEPCKDLNKMLKTACWKAHLCLLGPGCFTVID